MKLYDRLLLNGANWPARPVDADAGKRFAARNPVVVDLANVAQYRWKSDVANWTLDSYPIAASPWPVAWYEFRYDGADLGGASFSYLLESGYSYTTTQWFYRHPTREIPVILGDSAHWCDPQGAFLHGPGYDMERVSETVASSDELEWLESQCGHRIVGGYAIGWPAFPEDAPGDLADFVGRWLHGAAETMFLALSFAHCKNVKLVEHQTPPKVATKRMKAGKPVGVTYKTLVIDGMKQTLRVEGGAAQNGLKKALHICRGHFATYTPDRPLFGKVVGTVWKPMHTRGSKERGQVVKDYKVVANDQ